MPEKTMRRAGRAGFTLVELIVVVLIIGVLAAFSIPSYLKSVENTKADDAASMANMLATANRLFALDHQGGFVSGQITNACNTSTSCTGTLTDPCQLIACKYMASSDFDSKPYVFCLASKAACASACGSYGGSNVACAKRKDCASSNTPGCTSNGTYKDYGYAVDANNVIAAQGGAPTAAQ